MVISNVIVNYIDTSISVNERCERPWNVSDRFTVWYELYHYATNIA